MGCSCRAGEEGGVGYVTEGGVRGGRGRRILVAAVVGV